MFVIATTSWIYYHVIYETNISDKAVSLIYRLQLSITMPLMKQEIQIRLKIKNIDSLYELTSATLGVFAIQCIDSKAGLRCAATGEFENDMGNLDVSKVDAEVLVSLWSTWYKIYFLEMNVCNTFTT